MVDINAILAGIGGGLSDYVEYIDDDSYINNGLANSSTLPSYNSSYETDYTIYYILGGILLSIVLFIFLYRYFAK
jgi:hypothetical protein